MKSPLALLLAVALSSPLAALAAAGDPKIAAFIQECAKGGTTEAEIALRDKVGEFGEGKDAPRQDL